jgi:nonribosomal peptide synthetase DhbF
VGFFVNTLVLRVDASKDPSFRELIARVRAVDLAAYENQDVPFEYLVETLNPARSTAHQPLFQVALVVQNAPPGDFDLPGLSVAMIPVVAGVAKFDLTISLRENRDGDGAAGGLAGYAEYSTDLFERETVEDLVGRWLRLLEAVSADPDLPISRIDILTPEERRQMLGEWSVGS